MKNGKSRILVLASGKGSTFEFLAQSTSENWTLSGLLVDREDCGALNTAEKYGIPSKTCGLKTYTSLEDWDAAFTNAARTFQPDLIVLAGFLYKLGPQFLQAFSCRVINTHPSLLPKYGGKGMYGRRVHEKVIANGDQVTGVTVHWVESEYDSGAVVAQLQIPVSPSATAEELEARVKEKEKDFLLETLNRLTEN